MINLENCGVFCVLQSVRCGFGSSVILYRQLSNDWEVLTLSACRGSAQRENFFKSAKHRHIFDTFRQIERQICRDTARDVVSLQ